MPPADRVKAATALRMRTEGHSWKHIASAVGFASHDSARVAAEREQQRQAVDADVRRIAGGDL